MEQRSERPGRRATIRDVARRAGVSVGTVSHVLNSSKSASAEAQRAVAEAVAALNYRPNSLARSLMSRRSLGEVPAKPAMPRLVAVGYLSIDYMVQVDHVPCPGERMTSRGIEKTIGGPAANVAAFAAGLGPPFEMQVELVTQLGDDADSAWAMEVLAGRGVDASGAYLQPGGRLSRCIVLVDRKGARTIVNEPLHIPVDLVTRHLGEPWRAARSCVHFDGFHLAAAEKAAAELRRHGHLLSMHAAGIPQPKVTPSRCAAWLRTFDVIFLDRASVAQLLGTPPAHGAGAQHLLDSAVDATCQALVVTAGAGGATLFRPGEAPVHAPATAVEVVDATGAGDAFAGLFLASWLTRDELEAALAHAVAGAGLSLTALGAQGRLVSAAELRANAPDGEA